MTRPFTRRGNDTRKARRSSQSERERARRRAIDDASHPRAMEITQARSPRYGAFVERDDDKVTIHLLREWGERERRIDSVIRRSFDGEEVEAAASCLEDLRHEGVVRESRDLDEWLRQKRRAQEKAARASNAAHATTPLSKAHQRELAQMRADRQARAQAAQAGDKRNARIEAQGLVDALRAQRPSAHPE